MTNTMQIKLFYTIQIHNSIIQKELRIKVTQITLFKITISTEFSSVITDTRILNNLLPSTYRSKQNS